MEKLHDDIILNILSRLPHQSIINCKLVCKPWHDLLCNTKEGLLFILGSPVFKGRLYYGGERYCDDISIHDKEEYSYETLPRMDNFYPFDDQLEPVCALSDMVGSCNGLVCFKIFDKNTWVSDPIYICNPVTGEYVYLPKFIYGDGYPSGQFPFICGFGYSHSTDEYKVVRIYHRLDSMSTYTINKVQVYTLGSGQGWRDKGSIDDSMCNISTLLPGVCANGALYWSGFGKIVAFDLAKEEFRVVSLPPSPHIPATCLVSLRLLRGYLSIIHWTGLGGEEDSRRFVHIWALKKKKKKCTSSTCAPVVDDDMWCWNEEFSFSWEDPADGMYVPFAITKADQVLMWCKGFLFYYDPQTTTLTKLWGESWMFKSQTVPHLNTLVWLEALGEKSKRRT